MCGVFGLSKHSLDDRYMGKWNIEHYFAKDMWPDRFNIRPTQESPVITQRENGTHLELMKFGLIPSWSKTAKLEFNTINAKSETIDQLASFKKPFKEKRCLVLADFFFEFLKTDEGSQPYLFKVKNHSGPLVFAGVWDENINAGDKPIKSFAIVTVPANSTVGQVHPRMPAVLDDFEAQQWLSPTADPEQLKKFLKPYSDTNMDTWRVSKLVNFSRNEGSDLIRPT